MPHIYLNTDATNEALIDGATNGIDFNVPALDYYQFKYNNVTKWTMTTTQLGGDNIILNQSLVFNNSSSDPSANGEITRNGNYLKVQTDGLVKDLTCVSGYKDSTSSQSVGTNTTLDGWFGDVDGCVGVQYNSSASAGTGKYRIWIRADGGLSLIHI